MSINAVSFLPSDMLPRGNIYAVYNALLEVVMGKLSETASLVEDNTKGLSERFVAMARGAHEQSESVDHLRELVNYLSVGDQKINTAEFIQEFVVLLSDSVERVLQISKMAMSMVYDLGEAAESLTEVDAFVTAMQRINKQTHLLALNASIEAAHFGESGKGFLVVADEVKNVSADVSALADSMRGKLNAISENVAKSFQSLEKVATTDLSPSLSAKEKVQMLSQVMLQQNERLTQALISAVANTESISKSINNAVVDLQFQDRNSQMIYNSIRGLEALSAFLFKVEASRVEVPEAPRDALTLLKGSFTLGEFWQLLLEQAGQKGVEETVEFAASQADVQILSAGDTELF